MIFRRRPTDKAADQDAESDLTATPAGDAASDADDVDALKRQRPNGPWDRDETTADEDEEGYIDLGGLVVRGIEGIELRLQVADQEGTIAAVLLAGPESGLEVRAFAAPRYDGIWDDVRADIAAEAVRRGGTASEIDGEFGTELSLSVPLQAPDGRQAIQPSRIVGVEGPRWLLRGTFLGTSALKPDPAGQLEAAFRDIIVVRGNEPMAPRETLPMRMPPQAQSQLMAEAQAQAEAAAQGELDAPDEPMDGAGTGQA